MTLKKSLIKIELISTIFSILFGIILHFTYNYSKNNIIIASFSAINESTWEHLKILFFPMLITTIIGHILLKRKYPNYLDTKTKGILVAISFIIIFFYTYSGIIGKNFPILDISSFIIAIFLEEIYTYKKIKTPSNTNNIMAIKILITLSICFIVFTFFPPKINLFKDPITNSYGIQEK